MSYIGDATRPTPIHTCEPTSSAVQNIRQPVDAAMSPFASSSSSPPSSSLAEQRYIYTSRLLAILVDAQRRWTPEYEERSNALQRGMSRIVEMTNEDSQRHVEQSLIDLNQCHSISELDVVDVLTGVVELSNRILSDEQLAKSCKAMLETLIWPRIMALMNLDGSDHECYDMQRVFWSGGTALHFLCASRCHMLSGNITARLAERLLQLGADPNALDFSNHTPLIVAASGSWTDSADALFPLIRLLLDHGADINVCDKDGWPCMYYLIGEERFDMLQRLYDDLPQVMSGIDYSTTFLCRDRWINVFDAAAGALKNAQERETTLGWSNAEAILNLLTEQAKQQYHDIQQALHLHTPLKLNDHTDLTDIVLSYIKAVETDVDMDGDSEVDDD